ncbi:MAG: hypothetical protein IJV14_01905 [Lachnospiraceae bacterium]|nr:hypothetical protein [Lachnospiraceae bacterium]
MNDYYGEQIDNFTFYRVPKALFTDSRYKSSLSAEAINTEKNKINLIRIGMDGGMDTQGDLIGFF